MDNEQGRCLRRATVVAGSEAVAGASVDVAGRGCWYHCATVLSCAATAVLEMRACFSVRNLFWYGLRVDRSSAGVNCIVHCHRERDRLYYE